MRDSFSLHRAGARGNDVSGGIDQFETVIAFEVIAPRIQGTANRHNFSGVQHSVMIYQKAGEPDEKIADRRGGLPDAVGGGPINRVSC